MVNRDSKSQSKTTALGRLAPPEPGWQYGEILPLRHRQNPDTQRQELEWAVPGFARDDINALLALAERGGNAVRGALGLPVSGEVLEPGDNIPANELLALAGSSSAVGSAPRGALGSFVSHWAVDHPEYAKDLERAMRARDAGETNDLIWKHSGWSKDFADEIWRREISDASARVVPRLPSRDTGRLGDIWQAPDLYKAHPSMRDIQVEFSLSGDPRSAGYSPSTDTIRLHQAFPGKASPSFLRGTLLHEGQHALQAREGLSMGSSPNRFMPPRLMEDVKDNMRQLVQAGAVVSNNPDSAQLFKLTYAELGGKPQGLTDALLTQLLPAALHYNFDPAAPLVRKAVIETELTPMQLAELTQKLLLRNPDYEKFLHVAVKRQQYRDMEDDIMRSYRSVAGETEANLVAQRGRMTTPYLRELSPQRHLEALAKNKISTLEKDRFPMFFPIEQTQHLGTWPVGAPRPTYVPVAHDPFAVQP